MILRRTDEGAAKCALRALRREEETSVGYQHELSVSCSWKCNHIRAMCIPSSSFFHQNTPFLQSEYEWDHGHPEWRNSPGLNFIVGRS